MDRCAQIFFKKINHAAFGAVWQLQNEIEQSHGSLEIDEEDRELHKLEIKPNDSYNRNLNINHFFFFSTQNLKI